MNRTLRVRGRPARARLWARLVTGTLLCGLMVPAMCQGALEAKDAQPIRIVVTFPPGGIMDVVCREVAERLSSRFGRPALVENRSGAGGAIGAEYVARSNPDGKTLLCASPNHAVTPHLLKSASWHPLRDFKGVAGIGVSGYVVVVPADSKATTLKEWIALARARDKPLVYGTPGIGTPGHLGMELMAQRLGIPMSAVHYRGQPDALNDLNAGRLDVMELTTALAKQHVDAGRLRALAVASSWPVKEFPGLPTVEQEARLPGYHVEGWIALLAPAGVPAERFDRLVADVRRVLELQEVKQRWPQLGLEAWNKSPSEVDEVLRQTWKESGEIVRSANLKSD